MSKKQLKQHIQNINAKLTEEQRKVAYYYQTQLNINCTPQHGARHYLPSLDTLSKAEWDELHNIYLIALDC